MKELFNIHFAAWHWIVLVPVLVILICIRLVHEWRRSRAIRVWTGAQRAQLVRHFSLARQIIKTILLIGGLSSLLLALLRPCWGKTEERISQEGRDIVIAFDVSRSMLVQDLKPNRMTFAKNKVKQLLSQLQSERVALLIFAGSALVQCPLTTDYNAFYLFLDTLDAQTISSGTTAIDQALRKALQLFADTGTQKTKLLVMLTDGEDFSSNLSSVKQEAVQQGLTIFTLGIGTEQGGPVPVLDMRGNQQGYEKDAQGAVIMSRLNEGILRALAHETGGTYLTAQENASDVQEIKTQVEQFEREKFEDKTVVHWQERYFYFAAVACACLLLEWFL
ncbi:MAG: VWA domain-containing protein [Candidatus Babeliales bacterium]